MSNSRALHRIVSLGAAASITAVALLGSAGIASADELTTPTTSTSTSASVQESANQLPDPLLSARGSHGEAWNYNGERLVSVTLTSGDVLTTPAALPKIDMSPSTEAYPDGLVPPLLITAGDHGETWTLIGSKLTIQLTDGTTLAQMFMGPVQTVPSPTVELGPATTATPVTELARVPQLSAPVLAPPVKAAPVKALAPVKVAAPVNTTAVKAVQKSTAQATKPAVKVAAATKTAPTVSVQAQDAPAATWTVSNETSVAEPVTAAPVASQAHAAAPVGSAAEVAPSIHTGYNVSDPVVVGHYLASGAVGITDVKASESTAVVAEKDQQSATPWIVGLLVGAGVFLGAAVALFTRRRIAHERS